MLTRSIRITGLMAFLAMTLASCGGGAGPLGECPPNSQSQQDFGANVIFFTCTGCHSMSLQGADREGAPVGKDYDTPEMVRPQAEEIYEWVLSGTMPPPDGLNEQQMEYVRIYLACGAPE